MLNFTPHSCDVWTNSDDRIAGGVSPPVAYSRAHTSLSCAFHPMTDTAYRDDLLAVPGDRRRVFLPSTVTSLPGSSLIYDLTTSTLWEIIDDPDPWKDPKTGSLSHWECRLRKAAFIPAEISAVY